MSKQVNEMCNVIVKEGVAHLKELGKELVPKKQAEVTKTGGGHDQNVSVIHLVNTLEFSKRRRYQLRLK